MLIFVPYYKTIHAMKTKKLLFAAAMLTALGAGAQSVPTHEMYVQYATPSDIVTALKNWEPGKNFGVGTDYHDENFFISRVPVKERFLPDVWANPDLNDENDKYLCWCVPTGEMTKKWGALPRYNFDGDNFNLWQYVNTHSNWSNGWWRVPGAFNDAAHKNGVRTGCTYFIDWGAGVNIYNEPGKTLHELSEQQFDGTYTYARKLVEFMRYYGITGLTFNPEGSWATALANQFQGFLAECHRVADELNYPFHVDWYAFVSNTGALSDNGCQLTSYNDWWFHNKDIDKPVTDVFFLNYNWSESGLANSVATAQSLGRNTFDVYAGFDQQGRGYGKYGNAGWDVLMKYPVSVVVWGAHDRSQLYASSTEGGQSDYAVQNEYQKKQELLFCGGNRNVLDLPAINTGNTTAKFSDLATWHGYAKAVRERSTLSEVPFVTRFNLGNGRFVKREGQTTWEHKWYNIGMQDLLPTWRWWKDNGDGHTVPADALETDFCYDDAWYGGSCLKLHGQTARTDLRLFATRWQVAGGEDTFRLVYKVNSGTESHLQLMVAKQNGEDNFARVALPDAAKAGEWTTATVKAADLGLKAGDVIGCVGLSAQGTPAGYELLLGEMAFVPAAFAETPQTPSITYTEIMRRYYNRADFKVVFDMPTPANRPAKYVGCPVYNEEVGAWYYEVYVKQGSKETLVTNTTSWAAYVVDAPLDVDDPTFQIGIRAIGKDGKAMSPITWSEKLESPLTMIETLTIDKDIIKPGEEFTIGFEDPNHPACDINIYDAMTGAKMASAQNTLTMTTSLPATGSYDVEVVSAGTSLMNRSLILVSPEETGRLPQIGSITADKTEAKAGENIHLTAEIQPGTTYNDAPCTVSQSLYMQEPYQFTVSSNLMSEYTTNSYALWFKVEKFEHASLGTLLMTKVNRNYGGTWTESVWGEMWTAIRPEGYAKSNNIARNNAANEISVSFDGPRAGTYGYEHNNDVDGLSDGYTLQPGNWYHVCVVKNGKNDVRVYLNGKKIIQCASRGAGPKDWRGANFYVGGSMTNLASFTGWVDEVQIWSKALTDEEVLQSMRGYSQAPDGLEGYFTFESTQTDADGNIFFPNMGRAAAAVPGGYMTIGKEESGKTVDVKQNQLTTALGVPSITGTNVIRYESSKWMLDGATVTGSTDTEATAKYGEEGTFPVTVVASNSWGSVSKTVTDYIVIRGAEDGIHGVSADGEAGCMIYPKPFEHKADLLFAENGEFTVKVFAADGKNLLSEDFEARAGELKEINLSQAAAGTYVVVVTSGGKALRSFKIMVK